MLYLYGSVAQWQEAIVLEAIQCRFKSYPNYHGDNMTDEEIIKLKIEKAAYLEVVKQLSKGDARMETGLDDFLCDIEDKIKDINKKLQVNTTNREEQIRQIANRIWQEAGCPDGEKEVLFFGKMVKLKDVHWAWAETEWQYGPDYFRLL